jgi:septal ring factor EnvC (AmiA/AmiB activator)
LFANDAVPLRNRERASRFNAKTHPTVRQMENPNQLQAKLDRTQAEIEKGIGRLIRQRARVARRLAESEDVTQSQGLLATLEDTQLLHVQHRDRLRRKLDWSLPGKNVRP